jgi:hypothetical protein
MEHFALGACGHLITPLRKHFGLPLADDPALDAFDVLLQAAVIADGVADGVVTKTRYEQIAGAWPDTFERSLMVVAFAENHGFFTNFNDNVDTAGVTAGIIGFTAKSGSLLRLLSAMKPIDVTNALAANGLSDQADALRRLLLLGNITIVEDPQIEAKCVEAAVNLFTGTNAGKMAPAWKKFFVAVLRSDDARNTQRAQARKEYFDGPRHSDEKAAENGLTSEYGRLLAFSIFVQSGGMTFTPPLSGGEERQRRLLAGPRRGAQISLAVSNFERRHVALAKGVGFPNFRFVDLSAWGFTSPDTDPPAKKRIQSIRLSDAAQLNTVTAFETEAVGQGIVDERVTTPDLTKVWRPELAIMKPPEVRKPLKQPRRKAVDVLAGVDELPLTCLVLAARAGSPTTFTDPKASVGFRGKRGILRFAAADLDLPLVPRMKNGLVILYGPNGIAKTAATSFGDQVRRSIATSNDTAAPLILGWIGNPPFPDPSGPNCAAAFFSAVKAAMAPADAPKSIDTLIFFSPETIIQAWGKACHETFANKPFSGLWRRHVKQGAVTVIQACAAVAPTGNIWRAVAVPANDIFMERIS